MHDAWASYDAWKCYDPSQEPDLVKEYEDESVNVIFDSWLKSYHDMQWNDINDEIAFQLAWAPNMEEFFREHDEEFNPSSMLIEIIIDSRYYSELESTAREVIRNNYNGESY